MAKGKKVALTILGVLVAGAAVFPFTPFGDATLDVLRTGILEQDQSKDYSGTRIDNLRAMHTALMLYHDSEGQFPDAKFWMDAIEKNLQTADLKPGEGKKKLRNPELPEGQYGFGMNSAASGKYVDDVPGAAKAILVFDSKDTNRNAHGDPAELVPEPPRPGGNLAITIEGTLLRDGKPEQAP